MLPVEEGQFLGMQCMAMRWPNRLKQAAAVCNSLTLINKSQVVGDVADKQAFKAVEARFVVSHNGNWLATMKQLHVTPAFKPCGRYWHRQSKAAGSMTHNRVALGGAYEDCIGSSSLTPNQWRLL